MTSKAHINFWVGIFTIIAIGAIAFLSLRVSDLGINPDSSSFYIVRAEFDNIGSLKVRSPVKSSGVIVGRVVDISLDKESYKAVVTIAIDQRYDFSSDVSAQILTAGLLGEQYIGLVEGGLPDKLRQSGEITVTSSALVLEELINKVILSVIESNKTGQTQ